MDGDLHLNAEEVGKAGGWEGMRRKLKGLEVMSSKSFDRKESEEFCGSKVVREVYR